mgnify:FL=1
MTQSTATIESVWASKGNSSNSAIVATADAKYPALDGSLITNINSADAKLVTFILPCASEDGSASVATGVVTFRVPSAFTLTGVRASCKLAPTGSTLIVDVNNGGTSVLSTKLSVDIGETTSTTAAVAAVISSPTIADDAVITIDIDQVGSTVAGTGVKVSLYGTT